MVTWLLPWEGEEAGCPPMVHKYIQALHQALHITLTHPQN